MTKTNARSVRLSANALEIVEAASGNNFAQKLECVILDFDEKKEAREQALQRINSELERKEEYLRDICKCLKDCNIVIDKFRFL